MEQKEKLQEENQHAERATDAIKNKTVENKGDEKQKLQNTETKLKSRKQRTEKKMNQKGTVRRTGTDQGIRTAFFSRKPMASEDSFIIGDW